MVMVMLLFLKVVLRIHQKIKSALNCSYPTTVSETNIYGIIIFSSRFEPRHLNRFEHVHLNSHLLIASGLLAFIIHQWFAKNKTAVMLICILRIAFEDNTSPFLSSKQNLRNPLPKLIFVNESTAKLTRTPSTAEYIICQSIPTQDSFNTKF